jgi:hypothetical protein
VQLIEAIKSLRMRALVRGTRRFYGAFFYSGVPQIKKTAEHKQNVGVLRWGVRTHCKTIYLNGGDLNLKAIASARLLNLSEFS